MTSGYPEYEIGPGSARSRQLKRRIDTEWQEIDTEQIHTPRWITTPRTVDCEFPRSPDLTERRLSLRTHRWQRSPDSGPDE
jgi:hypothetical protein